MDNLEKELDRWCSRVPGLVRAGNGIWEHAEESAVSFPEEGLASLANIEPGSYWFNHRNKVIAAAIRLAPPSGAIFDIGGGNGYVSAGLREAGFGCVVVEPDVAGAEVARWRGLPVIRAAFQSLELAENSIAAAGMFDVLEHIEDEIDALRRLARVLRPGGMVYIAVPAYNFLWSKQDVYGGHFRRYTLDRLENSLRSVGLAPVYGTYFFSALVPAVLLFRVIPGYFGVSVSDQGAQVARDHALPRGRAGSILSWSFEREMKKIANGGSVGFGSSCFVAARKS